MQGRVHVNGKAAKPSQEVKEGDLLRLEFGARILEIRILEIKKQVSKQNASLLFEVVKEERIEEKD